MTIKLQKSYWDGYLGLIIGLVVYLSPVIALFACYLLFLFFSPFCYAVNDFTHSESTITPGVLIIFSSLAYLSRKRQKFGGTKFWLIPEIFGWFGLLAFLSEEINWISGGIYSVFIFAYLCIIFGKPETISEFPVPLPPIDTNLNEKRNQAPAPGPQTGNQGKFIKASIKKIMLTALAIIAITLAGLFWLGSPIKSGTRSVRIDNDLRHAIMTSFINNIASGKIEEAYNSQLSKNFKDEMPLQDFTEGVRSFPELQGIKDINFDDVESFEIIIHEVEVTTQGAKKFSFQYGIAVDAQSGEAKIAGLGIFEYEINGLNPIKGLEFSDPDPILKIERYIDGQKVSYLKYHVTELSLDFGTNTCEFSNPKEINPVEHPDTYFQAVCKGVDVKIGKKYLRTCTGIDTRKFGSLNPFYEINCQRLDLDLEK